MDKDFIRDQTLYSCNVDRLLVIIKMFRHDLEMIGSSDELMKIDEATDMMKIMSNRVAVRIASMRDRDKA